VPHHLLFPLLWSMPTLGHSRPFFPHLPTPFFKSLNQIRPGAMRPFLPFFSLLPVVSLTGRMLSLSFFFYLWCWYDHDPLLWFRLLAGPAIKIWPANSFPRPFQYGHLSTPTLFRFGIHSFIFPNSRIASSQKDRSPPPSPRS